MEAAVWFLDRGSALLAYPLLYVATLTGVLYEAESFGWLHEASRRVHIELATFAMLVVLLHAGLGVLDAWLVVAGAVPQPSYSMGFFLGGVAVGVGALLLLVVAVMGFLDARRFRRPWGPRVVHAFAYGGFAFATLHAVAVGTDVVGLVRTALVASTAFLVYVLLLRALAEANLLPSETPAGQ